MIKSAKKPTSNLSSLSLTSALVNFAMAVDPTMDRRRRLITRLLEQKELLANPGLTKTVTEGKVTKAVKVRSWVRPAPDGSLVFMIKSGLKALELNPGKSAVAVKSLDQLPRVIDQLVAATEAGELDDAMALAAAQSARKAKAKSAA